MRYYYASIEWGVDFQVGRIMEALKKKGVLDNTIVIVASDHGDFMGQHRMVRKAIFLYDALLHIPFIVYAPHIIGKGLRVKNVAQAVDLFPTLADLTGGEIPENLSGRSLKPFLKGKTIQEKDFAVFASAAYSDLPKDYFSDPEPPYDPDSDIPFHTRVQRQTWQEKNRIITARTQEWRLILSESRPTELYRMSGKWAETKNLAEDPQFSRVRKSLESQCKRVWNWD